MFVVRAPGPVTAVTRDGVDVRDVTTVDDLRVLERVAIEGYPIDEAKDSPPGTVFTDSLLESPVALRLGDVDGEPVSGAAALDAHGVVNLCFAATLGAGRRKGVWSALVWARVNQAPEQPSVAFTSDDSRPGFVKMGFMPVTRFTLMVRPPAALARHRARHGVARRLTSWGSDEREQDATRNDRPRPHGREPGAAPDARRPRLRGVRREQADAVDELAGEGATGAYSIEEFVGEAQQAACGVDHGAGRVRRRHDREAGRAPRAGRHHHRRRQLVLPRRHRPGRAPAAQGHPLRRRRHQWRRVRSRPRLLPDDRRRGRHRHPPRPDLPHHRARGRHRPAHAGPHRRSVDRRERATSTAGPTAPATS